MKILFKLAITRRAVFISKCTQNRFYAGLCPDTLGELTALPQTSYLDLRGLLLRKGRGEWGGERKEGEGRGREDRRGKGRRSGLPPYT